MSADTLRVFLKFLYQDEVRFQDVDCGLLLAADQFRVKRLINICSKHLKEAINHINVLEITGAAWTTQNEDLLKAASKFIFDHRGSIKKSGLWDQIKVQHPGIVEKVMDLIVFEETSECKKEKK